MYGNRYISNNFLWCSFCPNEVLFPFNSFVCLLVCFFLNINIIIVHKLVQHATRELVFFSLSFR